MQSVEIFLIRTLAAFAKKVLPLHREKLLLTHGVIGNTADFGSVI
jgi:hypothetical protein